MELEKKKRQREAELEDEMLKLDLTEKKSNSARAGSSVGPSIKSSRVHTEQYDGGTLHSNGFPAARSHQASSGQAEGGHLRSSKRTEYEFATNKTRPRHSLCLREGTATACADNESFRSILSKLKLPENSGDPLDWPKWAGLSQVTVHAANITDSTNMQHLKTLVTGEAKEAITGLVGVSFERYHTAWNILVTKFGNPQIAVNAQLKKVFSHSPVKITHLDLPALIRYSTIPDNRNNVLTSFQYNHDLHSESVVSGSLRKLPLEWRAKWLSHVEKMQLFQPGLDELSQWLSRKSLAQEATPRTVATAIPGITSKTSLKLRHSIQSSIRSKRQTNERSKMASTRSGNVNSSRN